MYKMFKSLLLAVSLISALSACGSSSSTTPPATLSVTSTTPLNRVNGAAIQSTISAVFSKAVDTTTINTGSFIVTGATGTVTGTLVYDTTGRKAVFTPESPLTKIAVYTATVTTAVKDTDGNPMAADYSWSFTTGPLIAARENHSMVLKSDGTIWAWGLNDYGQLGDGSTTDRETPVLVTAVTGTNVVSAAAGGYHSLALMSDGTVSAWGENGNGQLGDGNSSWEHGLGPVQVQNLTGVVALAAGYWHSMALRIDGTVWAWGSNSRGQLGDGTQNHRYTPVRVSGLTSVIAIAAGTEFSLALKSDGTVWAWGDNNYGEMGNGGSLDDLSAVPVQVAGLSGITAISAGYSHGLALKSDGTVWAWGRNDSNECGTDYVEGVFPTPAPVSSLSGITEIAAGGWHNLVRKSDGTVLAWGSNYYKQSGSTSTDVNILTPVQVTNLSSGAPVAALATGENHSFAMKSDGTLYSWGNNELGQVGVGIGDPTYEAAAVTVGVY